MIPPAALANLPKTVRLFPLDGVLLLPRAILPLNIFEPRYLAMVTDAMTSDKMIAIIQPRTREPANAPILYDVGTLGRITQYKETGDGRFHIALTGMVRFRLTEELIVPTAYRQASVDYTEFAADWSPPAPLAAAARADLEQQLKAYLEGQSYTADWEAIRSADDESLVNTLAAICPFTPPERQALLEGATLADRASTLSTLMSFATKSGELVSKQGAIQ